MYHTRIAPSPTGFAHVGTMRTALFNWLAARATGGTFTLRIDDTDTERNNEAAVQPILDGLTWLGLGWDHMFRQSDRSDTYAMVAKRLLEAGHAFEADNGAIILRWHDYMPRSWTDEASGTIAITDTNVEQIDGRTVLLRGGDKQGQATYQFASVVDDWDKGINYIIRGVDHVSNTAKQFAIWSAINKTLGGADIPKACHVGLIFHNKKKMSKRDGAASVLQYRDDGFHPDALFNAMLRLGWGPSEDNKANAILSRERAIELFIDGGRMRSANSNFDPAKLAHFNKVFSRGK